MYDLNMRIAQFGQVSLEFEIRGAGEPVALIHLAPYADSFLPLMDQPALSSYRLLRYRRRGYGDSARTTGRVTISDNAADLGDLLRHLGIERLHVVGHSYGGLIALQLAADHPDMVRSIVLMEPALRVRTSTRASDDLTQRMSIGFQCYRNGDREGAVDGFLGATFDPGYRNQIEQILPGWWAKAVHGADAFFGGELPELQAWQFNQAMAERITAPVLSVRGCLSHPAFRDFEDLLREWFPHLETTEVPGVDHRLHLQNAGPVAAALAEFFATHPFDTAVGNPLGSPLELQRGQARGSIS